MILILGVAGALELETHILPHWGALNTPITSCFVRRNLPADLHASPPKHDDPSGFAECIQGKQRIGIEALGRPIQTLPQ
jgi:hypothetical protein